MKSWKSPTLIVITYATLILCFRSTTEHRELLLGEWRPGGEKYVKAKGSFALHPLAREGFTPEQCNLEGVEKYPSGTAKWQQNAPSFLISGVPKAGTTTLSALLKSHPTVFGPTTKELNIFRKLPIEENLTISVRKARTLLQESGSFPVDALIKHPHAMSFDGTPNYFFYSSTLLPQVICVCPWIKIIVVLRDPIERLYSDFKSEIQRGSIWANTSLAQIIDTDIRRLHFAGLNSTAQKAASEEEQLAWHRYQSLTRKGWLGKGVYDIQLRLLLQKMYEFGKSRSDLLILTTNQLEYDLVGTYDRVLQFLGLHHTVIRFTKPRNQGTLKRAPMHIDLRRRLEAFYGPYNARLRGLLDDPGMAFDTYERNTEAATTTTKQERLSDSVESQQS